LVESAYSFTLNLDGAEQTGPLVELSRADAVAAAKVRLLAVVETAGPEAAFCAVFDDDEPLGCWSYDRGVIAWEPAE
jgi:hypothetical protein